MNKSLLLILFVYVLLVFNPVYAAEKDNKHPTVSPWVYKKLIQAEKHIANKAYGEARRILTSTLAKVDQGSYEQATILRSLSSIYALQEKYVKAADALAQALALHALPADQEQQALLNLGQLYMALEQYRKAIDILEPWLVHHTTADTEIHVLMANAYAQLKQYRKALPHIEKAIKQAKKPIESWYQLNLALYLELKEYQPAANLLERLISRFPDNKDYWDQLTVVYQQLNKFTKALTIKHLAYKKGLLVSEKELLELANLLLYVDSPYRAAELLAQEMSVGRVSNNAKNQELLANAWTQAREFEAAIVALEKASRLNGKGELYLRLGQIYVERELWQQAIEAINNAFKKGGLKATGSAYVLLGISHYELKQIKQAKQAFTKASSYKTTKQAAQQWLNYISQEANTAKS
jgi:tetratricopeptide (TPR) repeat protein